MNIAEAARRAGVSTERTRHYAAIGLLPKHADPDSYGERDVHTLCFIRRARAVGFAIGEIRTLLELWRKRERPGEEVVRLAQAHAQQIQTRIAVLQAMLLALQQLTQGCQTGERPHCPILQDAGCDPP